MRHLKMSTLAAALALAGIAPAALAQQAPGQEMDHSQHMMHSAPAQAPAAKPGPGPSPMGMKQGGGMGGMDHDMGGGMGCGMMGGKGGGMGGKGGGMKGGMMGGMGGGMKGGAMGGMRPRGIDVPLHVTGPLSHMDLTPEQDGKILRIQDELRKKHHEVKGRMMDEQVKLRDLYLADKQEKAAILASYKRLGELRLQMVEAGLDAQGRIDAVLSKEQRTMLKSHHPFWMMESVE
ncbi:MAG TPA: Spy/CpxP family protein refolding chaperone [Burkholderiales bacterium]|nr:Spy/CpxP family protein refolding chaperone [Burkholderiales bacterium]